MRDSWGTWGTAYVQFAEPSAAARAIRNWQQVVQEASGGKPPRTVDAGYCDREFDIGGILAQGTNVNWRSARVVVRENYDEWEVMMFSWGEDWREKPLWWEANDGFLGDHHMNARRLEKPGRVDKLWLRTYIPGDPRGPNNTPRETRQKVVLTRTENIPGDTIQIEV